MARDKRNAGGVPKAKTADYRHTSEKRKNIPLAKMAAEGQVPAVPKAKYFYNPHLSPVLRSDPTGAADRIQDLLLAATRRPLTESEATVVREATQHYQPWLEWAGKREEEDKGFFEVDPVALHIHERVSARAIIRAAMREDVQKELFADPQQPYQEAVQFYRHDIDWSNRLILGDSLQVMSSIARRENLAGKIQMIYVDPPYGIKFASNFQPEVRNRTVKEQDKDLTRESEMVKAYRDTWHVGVHSYLSYLRARLAVARELLADSGSIFVQIGDENLHLVRALMDEIYGAENALSIITFKKTNPLGSSGLAAVADYFLWYGKDRSQVKFRTPRVIKKTGKEGVTGYAWVELPDGSRRRLSPEEFGRIEELPPEWKLFAPTKLTAAGLTPSCVYEFEYEGHRFSPKRGTSWRTNTEGMRRVIAAERLIVLGEDKDSAYQAMFYDDYPVTELTNLWSDTRGEMAKQYVVQTAAKVIERCLLMTTDPGDLVLDPTCGSGTTAGVAEEWGRRWITVDTSRVAVAIARQRVLTARFEHYRTKDATPNPSAGFVYRTVPHITLKSIAQNSNLDPIFAKHHAVLEPALAACTAALKSVSVDSRRRLEAKLADKQSEMGRRAINESDRRRWLLPERKFEHWNVPFDTDAEWPKELENAVTAYRRAWRAKMDEVNACIAANAEQEDLVDEPEVTKGVVRVSGPFTVEGVRPEELSLGEAGLFDGTPTSLGDDWTGAEVQNIHAYLTRMVQHLRTDGLTFLNNKQRKFAQLEPLFAQESGSLIHAEGVWEGGDPQGPATVAVGFGPQYGPVTALQVEELIRASKRYDDLVVAGFSFDAEASAVIQEQSHPKLHIHQAYIRPDINPGMDGLLKDTPNSQLFTVFGQPELEVKQHKDGEWVCSLKGVDIYDPVANTIRSTGADKVAAWFLDQDYDGRCFCITQAFFPDQDAWEKIAKALGSVTDANAFEVFKGTQSLPFGSGKYGRIAVKVIDPRGNEVMAIRTLKD